jgi:hypothetical protein
VIGNDAIKYCSTKQKLKEADQPTKQDIVK